MPKVNREALFAYECYLPPLPEQKRIVKELDTLSEKVKALQNIYEKMLLDCEELKQSFLCKAFAGELQQQEVALFSLTNKTRREYAKRILGHIRFYKDVKSYVQIYTKQIANCDELKQSLLQKAFSGDL